MRGRKPRHDDHHGTPHRKKTRQQGHGDTTASGGVDGSDPGPCGHDPLVVRDAEGATAVEADPTPPKPWLLQASPT